ncbi:hypothetical protein KIL84_010579 [Mauremys mutica]|uniref:Uncharacterized protein n=1 Tax=Mauremys mutica TaxID=74926 RepID=A0A9D4AUJ9_9SAUR|nr:hypothetical protein KIL84_010579 [Mauremys mutica]
MQSCNAEALLLSAGLSTGALIAILLCIIILLVVLFAALKRQRKKDPLIISKDDVQDNTVTYNDEGGGEEDTQAFDIGTQRNQEAREESTVASDQLKEQHQRDGTSCTHVDRLEMFRREDDPLFTAGDARVMLLQPSDAEN